jgi:hypothetical protein
VTKLYRCPRRTVDELAACFIVKDSAGLKLAYVYFEEEPGAISGEPAHQDEA